MNWPWVAGAPVAWLSVGAADYAVEVTSFQNSTVLVQPVGKQNQVNNGAQLNLITAYRSVI